MTSPLQQATLFSGTWESRRTAPVRPQQMQMFSLAQTFEFGMQAHPQFAEAGTPTLQLTREDVRTPEEVERDLMRAAEALTTPLFGNGVAAPGARLPAWEEPDIEDEPEAPTSPPVKESVTKLDAYLAVITTAHEKEVTLWVDDAYRARFTAQLPEAIFHAQSAGLTAAEITAALQIGEHRGKREREASASPVVASAEGADTPTPSTPLPVLPLGFRARLRHEHISMFPRQWGSPMAIS